MLGAGIIVFREVLEAALVIGIVMAATRGVLGRKRWVSAGVLGGALGATIIAFFVAHISDMAEGMGQELMQAGILFSAVALIGWHVVWMHSHGREMAHKLKALGHAVTFGVQHMSVLAVVVGLAVLREGIEIVLLLQGLLLTSGTPAQLVFSSLVGLAVGAAFGFVLYRGFIAMPVNAMFTATNWVLILIAAGMAARGCNFLVQAGMLPSLGDRVWDTSAILSEHSVLGQLLVTLIGYMAQPSGVQVLAYLLTTGVIAMLMVMQKKHETAVKAAAMVALVILSAGSAQAATVKSPYIEVGELELEQKGVYEHDSVDGKDGASELEASVAYGVTAWFKPEVEVEFEGEPHEKVLIKKYKLSGLFQLTEKGEYDVDAGFFAEYAFGVNHEADSITYGPIFAKSIGDFDSRLNLFLTHEVGDEAGEGVRFKYRGQTVYNYTSWLKPGVEFFGDTKAHEAFREQSFKAGPVVMGKFPAFTERDGFKYELGYAFGATRADRDGSLRWKLEYELHL